MKIEELRVGNYVMFNNEICKISGYSHTFIHLNDNKKGCLIDFISPIELNDDVFKKLGMKEDTLCLNKYFYLQIETGVQIRTHCNSIYIDVNDQEYEISWDINKNLHQLQNLYFALTSKELTFIE